MKRLVVFSTLVDPQAQYCNLLFREVLRWTHGGIKAIFNHHIENTVPAVPRYNHRPVYGALHKGLIGRHAQTALEVTHALGRQMALKAFGLQDGRDILSVTNPRLGRASGQGQE
jgi:hypothetical protein